MYRDFLDSGFSINKKTYARSSCNLSRYLNVISHDVTENYPIQHRATLQRILGGFA